MASEKILESKKAKVAALTEKLQNSVSFLHSRKKLYAAFCIEGNGHR